MKKFVSDPNVTTNQEGTGSSGKHVSAEGGHPGSVGRHMQDSYAKRQMFYYGVEDNSALLGGNNASVMTTH